MIDMYCTDERLQDESDSLGKYLAWSGIITRYIDTEIIINERIMVTASL